MRLSLIAALVLAGSVVAGCANNTRMKTEIVEVPRVDLQVEGAGNRGYLLGTPPAPSAMKTTRQIVETTVELPGMSDMTGPGQTSSGPGMIRTAPQAGDPQPQPSRSADAYRVKEGETLWSIAAQPEVYGDATQWKAILEANRDQLQDADSVQPGMQLKIPAIERSQGSYNTKDQSFK